MKTVILDAKTAKGKQRIGINGKVWKLIREKDMVQFSGKSGPWLFIESIKTGDTRWVNLKDDENFIATLLNT